MTDVLVAAFSDHDLVAHFRTQAVLPGGDLASMHDPESPVEWVRTDKLMPHREWHHGPGWSKSPEGQQMAPRHSPQEWADMVADVAANGIREPIHMNWDPKSNYAYIPEGNSRLAWAAEAGHEAVPVTGHRNSWIPDRRRYKLPGPSRGPELKDKFGHINADLAPSSFLPDSYMWHSRHEAAARPPRGSEPCNCCAGKGTHRDGSECKRCENGSISKDDQKTKPYCDGQRAPRRRRWRQVQAAGVEDYGMSHRPLSDGAPVHDLHEGYSEDIYTHPQYWAADWPDRASAEGLSVLRKIRGKPDAPVTIYRASPEGAPMRMHTGDWVSLSRSYAHEHAAQRHEDRAGEGWLVHKATVPAQHVRDAGTDQYREQGYWGPDIDSEPDRPMRRQAVAETYGPEPEYHFAPEDWDSERRREHNDREFDKRRQWKAQIHRGLSLGHITSEQAKGFGWWPSGHATESGSGRSLWQPLPHDMYHVTTDLPSVRRHGLKTRQELNQIHGHGLGGGEDDTVSLTTNHQLAGHILHALHEFHNVVNGRLTPQHMWDQARRGEGASRPFHHDIAHYWKSDWKEGDELPDGLRRAIEGTHRWYTAGTTQEMMDKSAPGARPAKGDEGWMTGHKPPQRAHAYWERDMSPDERRENAADFYKHFATHREHAGGPEDPMFFSTDTKAFAAKDPKNFAIMHVHPRPNAQGYPLHGMNEWRTGTGDALDVHHYEQEHGGQLHEAARSEMPDYRDRDALEAHLRIEHGWIPRKIDAMARGRYGLVHAHHTEHSEAERLGKPKLMDHDHDRWEDRDASGGSFIASITPKAHDELIEHMTSVHHFPSPEWRTPDQLAETHDMEHGYSQAEKNEAGIEPHRHDDEWEAEHSGWESGPDVFTGARKTAGWKEEREARGDRWHQFRNRRSDDLHRGMIVHLPEDVHRRVHDERHPVEERARELANHFTGSGLGMHWTPHVDIAHRSIWNAAEGTDYDFEHDPGDAFGGLSYPKTDVMLHVRRPAQRSVVRSKDVLDEHQVGWQYSKDEDEVPVKPGAPLHLTGISWKLHEPEYPNEPFEHHDFPRPIRAQGSVTRRLDQEAPGHEGHGGTVWLTGDRDRPRCTGCGHRVTDPDSGEAPRQTRELGPKAIAIELPNRQRAKRASAARYMYHGTSPRHRTSIGEQGLRTEYSQDPGEWKSVYMSDRPGNDPDQDVWRVDVSGYHPEVDSDSGEDRDEVGESWFVDHDIPPDRLSLHSRGRGNKWIGYPPAGHEGVSSQAVLASQVAVADAFRSVASQASIQDHRRGPINPGPRARPLQTKAGHGMADPLVEHMAGAR